MCAPAEGTFCAQGRIRRTAVRPPVPRRFTLAEHGRYCSAPYEADPIVRKLSLNPWRSTRINPISLLAHGNKSNFSNSHRCGSCLGDRRLQQHWSTDSNTRSLRLRRGDRQFLEAADAAQHRQAALWRLPGVHGDCPGHRRLSAADDGRSRRLRPELQRRVDRRPSGGRRFGGGGRDLHRPADRDLCAADGQRLHQEADDADLRRPPCCSCCSPAIPPPW